MGLKFKRQKERHLLLSVIYRIHKLLPLRNAKKLRLYLDLNWIFHRLAHETSFRYYQEENHPIRTKNQAFLYDRIKKEDLVVDIGCKHGYITAGIAKYAKKVIGIDYDKKAIAIAKNRHKQPNLYFICEEAYAYLKSNNQSFNTLILSHVLEHIDNPQDFLKRFAAFFEYIYIELPDFEASLLNEYRIDIKSKLTYLDNDHIHEFDRHELKQLVETAGLEIVASEFIYGVQKVWCKKKNDER